MVCGVCEMPPLWWLCTYVICILAGSSDSFIQIQKHTKRKRVRASLFRLTSPITLYGAIIFPAPRNTTNWFINTNVGTRTFFNRLCFGCKDWLKESSEILDVRKSSCIQKTGTLIARNNKPFLVRTHEYGFATSSKRNHLVAVVLHNADDACSNSMLLHA